MDPMMKLNEGPPGAAGPADAAGARDLRDADPGTAAAGWRVAVVGAGLAGSACAAALAERGAAVQLFDKSRGIGGRLSTRRLTLEGAVAAAADVGIVQVDHGAQSLRASTAAFAAFLAAGAAAGWLRRWPATADPAGGYTAVPDMPTLCRQLLQDLPVQTNATVTGLQRRADGRWLLALAEPASDVGADGSAFAFDQVVLALPPPQAAVLLRPHDACTAEALQAYPMQPCWTLMAVIAKQLPDRFAVEGEGADINDTEINDTDINDNDNDDVLMPAADSPLAWVARNDRKPGRAQLPGLATWVAQAHAEWSMAHRDAPPAEVQAALWAALQATLRRHGHVLAGAPLLQAAVHRWLYALPGAAALAAERSWQPALGIGLCGDGVAGVGMALDQRRFHGAEAAWLSGRQLARRIAACCATALPHLPLD